MSNIIKLADRTPQRALETLNRMTGLEFDCWPESLISASATAPTSSLPCTARNTTGRHAAAIHATARALA